MSRRGRGGRHRHNGRHGGNDARQRPNNRPDPRQQVKDERPSEGSSHPQQSSETRGQNPSKFSFQSAIQPRRTLSRPLKTPTVAAKASERKYQVIFFDTLIQAKNELESLRDLASKCDQLNIVIRAEAPMDDPDLTAVGKLFCGAAWTLIHERRRDAGWYEQAQVL